jgi:perosamine synthetase
MKKIPYATQSIDERDISAVVKALESHYLTQGPAVDRFEEMIAGYVGARYAVAVNSGTSALHMACLAAGLKKGDEGITSPITFAASANSMVYCGAKPVFADIFPDTVCIDPREVERKLSARTRAIIPVHYAGHPCDMHEIRKIARKSKAIVIEDACHALGASYKGSAIGSCKYSDMTVLSFHAVKHITTGEGGMVLTNNRDLFTKLVLLRTHGITKDAGLLKKKGEGGWYYEMQTIGFNYRLTDIQCSLGISQLKSLGNFLGRRDEIVRAYNDAFSGLDGISLIAERPYARSSNHLYVIRLDSARLRVPRKTVFQEFRDNGILVNVHYIPVYYHPYYERMGYRKGLCPEAEKFYSEAITLPLYPKMLDKDVRRVIDTTRTIIDKYRKPSNE